MSPIDVAVLKTAQDDLDTRSSAVLAKCKILHDGIIERLAEFTSAAIAVGLHEVEHCRVGANKDETLVTLKGWDLVVIMGPSANLEQAGGPLVARIFIYVENLQDAPLQFDALVFENESRCVLRVVEKSKLQIALQGSASRGSGRSFADYIIQYIYGFQNAWVQMPGLEGWRDRTEGRAPRQTIGFPAPKRTPSEATS